MFLPSFYLYADCPDFEKYSVQTFKGIENLTNAQIRKLRRLEYVEVARLNRDNAKTFYEVELKLFEKGLLSQTNLIGSKVKVEEAELLYQEADAGSHLSDLEIRAIDAELSATCRKVVLSIDQLIQTVKIYIEKWRQASYFDEQKILLESRRLEIAFRNYLSEQRKMARGHISRESFSQAKRSIDMASIRFSTQQNIFRLKAELVAKLEALLSSVLES